MTEPRKAQINDPRTKYTPASGVTFGGSVVQTFVGVNYTALVNSSVTKVIGGVELSSPAILDGGSGTYPVSAGNQISVSIPGVNGGAPVVVTFQAGDIVVLGGFPVLTVSRAAARINSTLAGFGVTYPVAKSTDGVGSAPDGRLRLTSANGAAVTVGDLASITVTDVTPGVLIAMGFGAGSSFTAFGHSAPKRGIITYTPDGLGAYMPLKGAGGEPSLSLTPSLTTVSGLGRVNVPTVPAGDPVFARLQPGPTSARVSYFRSGMAPGRIVTASSNFSTLLVSESVTVTVTDPDLPLTWSFPVVFSPAPLVVQDVADVFNQAWLSASIATASVRFQVSPPYFLPVIPGESNVLAFKLNGNATIFSDLTGLSIASDVIAKINADIALAGQASEGIAAADTFKFVEIQSFNGVGDPPDSVEILPSVAGGSGDAALRSLGVTPGLYVGFRIAKLFGNDEIAFTSPFFGPNSSITVAGLAPVMAKLGLPGASVVAPALPGTTPYVPPFGSIVALTPEVMEFGDVPTDQDTRLEEFDESRLERPQDPGAGVPNAGLPALLNALGQIDQDHIPRVLHFLGLDSLQLGARLLDAGPIQDQARIVVPVNSAVQLVTLIAEFNDSNGVILPIRVYRHATSFFITTNARVNTTGLFVQDNPGSPSGAVQIENDLTSLQHKPAGSAPWAVSNWETPIQLDASHGGGPVVKLGADLVSNALDLLKARVQTVGSTLLEYHLVWESNSQVVGHTKQRIYSMPGLTTGKVAITQNAELNSGGNWQRDSAGLDSSMIEVVDGVTTIYKQFAASASPWAVWDRVNIKVDDAVDIGGTVNLGRAIAASTLANRALPRIHGTHTPSGAMSRTLIASFALEGVSGNINYYIYRGQGFQGTYPGDVFLISCNAYWNESIASWNKENAGDNSSLIHVQASSLNWYFKGGNSPFTWPDSTWNLAFQTTRLGIRTPYTEDSFNTTATTFLHGKNNGIKAWGTAFFARSGGVLSIVTGDSWNIFNYSLDVGGQVVYANMYAPVGWDAGYIFGAAGYSVIATAQSFFFAPLPTTDKAIGIPVSSTQCAFSVYPYNTASTPYNLNTNGVSAGFTFLVLGK